MDFLDKIFEKLPYDKIIPLPNWQRFAGMGAVVALVVAIFYFAAITGLEETITTKTGELLKLQEQVRKLTDYKKQQVQLERLLARAEAELKEKKKILPTDREIDSLLKDISSYGLQAGLTFEKFTPKGEVPKGDYYAEVPVDIEVSGRFHNVLIFFDRIAHHDRIVTIGNVQMTAGKDKKDPTNLSVSLRAITYKFIEKPVGGPAASKGKG
ncbi:MAG: type 4a pilus biogenesis protein PilO [Nitrospinota bacterium]|nr:type 4a pilus biogenesis protein PilO [Nitrospinota bacterium]